MTFTRRQFLTSSAAISCPAFLRADDAPKGLVIGQTEGAAAGNAVLAAGGNAIDAIVTAALVAGVVALPSTGLGGYGGALVVAKPDGGTFAIDFNGTAPARARANMFEADDKGIVKGRANVRGWLAAGVPGVLAGLQTALDKHGTKTFAEAVKPAIKFAHDGFPISKGIATAIKGAKDQFAKDPGSAKLFFHNGQPLGEGQTFRNPDLAAMLEKLAANGRVDDFYKGGIAAKIAAAFKANGGLVKAADLAEFPVIEDGPIILGWQNHVVHTPSPTAGGLTILQALNALKALGWETWDVQDPVTVQARVEAIRIAWHDRLKLLGDPRHTESVVATLLAEKYAADSAAKIRAAIKAGKPVKAVMETKPEGGTIHLNAIDASGMTVALTFTHGEAFGSQVTVDGLGLTLGHGMSRFDPRPGHPNSIAPGKRPLHNMCPTVVTLNGKPTLALGATGGRRIPNTVFDVLCYRLGEGRDLVAAVRGPRMHTEGGQSLTLEAAWPAPVVDHFKAVGYVTTTGPGANANAIERDPTNGKTISAAR